jgi:hypothetical protein
MSSEEVQKEPVKAVKTNFRSDEKRWAKWWKAFQADRKKRHWLTFSEWLREAADEKSARWSG